MTDLTMADAMPDAAAVARALLQAGAVAVRPDAPVTFKSGLRSPVYVDNRRLIFHPAPWRVVIAAMAAVVRDRSPAVEVIAGVESAGIPHSSALAYATGMPSVFVRKEAKGHGLGQRVEGGEVAGRRVLLVEDMITSGGSSLAAVAALRDAGATADDCLAIITYGFAEGSAAFAAASVRLRTLTTFETVLDAAIDTGRLDEHGAAIVRAWLADPRGWTPPGESTGTQAQTRTAAPAQPS
jgi:orotate phosphoribosyltransferase